MAKIRNYTTVEQSRKLAEFLPIESADMYWWATSKRYYIEAMDDGDFNEREGHIRAWSLAALLSVLPTMIGNVFEKDALRLRIDKSETDFNVWYENLDTGMVEEGLDIIKSNPVDACVAMIERLHELNML